ncbi:hypothetical protein DIPPA_31342 [Diplonema papillatum]|nr:hypothetical protein DIPPA_31342 [Diplonema papillatum]
MALSCPNPGNDRLGFRHDSASLSEAYPGADDDTVFFSAPCHAVVVDVDMTFRPSSQASGIVLTNQGVYLVTDAGDFVVRIGTSSVIDIKTTPAETSGVLLFLESADDGHSLCRFEDEALLRDFLEIFTSEILPLGVDAVEEVHELGVGADSLVAVGACELHGATISSMNEGAVSELDVLEEKRRKRKEQEDAEHADREERLRKEKERVKQVLESDKAAAEKAHEESMKAVAVRHQAATAISQALQVAGPGPPSWWVGQWPGSPVQPLTLSDEQLSEVYQSLVSSRRSQGGAASSQAENLSSPLSPPETASSPFTPPTLGWGAPAESSTRQHPGADDTAAATPPSPAPAKEPKATGSSAPPNFAQNAPPPQQAAGAHIAVFGGVGGSEPSTPISLQLQMEAEESSVGGESLPEEEDELSESQQPTPEVISQTSDPKGDTLTENDLTQALQLVAALPQPGDSASPPEAPPPPASPAAHSSATEGYCSDPATSPAAGTAAGLKPSTASSRSPSPPLPPGGAAAAAVVPSSPQPLTPPRLHTPSASAPPKPASPTQQQGRQASSVTPPAAHKRLVFEAVEYDEVGKRSLIRTQHEREMAAIAVSRARRRGPERSYASGDSLKKRIAERLDAAKSRGDEEEARRLQLVYSAVVLKGMQDRPADPHASRTPSGSLLCDHGASGWLQFREGRGQALNTRRQAAVWLQHLSHFNSFRPSYREAAAENVRAYSLSPSPEPHPAASFRPTQSASPRDDPRYGYLPDSTVRKLRLYQKRKKCRAPSSEAPPNADGSP